MSASLVGSEMCIRDSQSPLAGARGCGGAWSCGLCLVLLGRRPSSHPVSYTHLTLPTICSV
eukprot:4616930-Alexandrium_andersonii.AAC.1